MTTPISIRSIARSVVSIVSAALALTNMTALAAAPKATPRSIAQPSVPDIATQEGAADFKDWVRYFNPIDGDKRIANLRAGVFFNDALGAFKYALAQQKPLIMIMTNRYSLSGARVISSVLPCPSVARFAQHAVFVVTEPGDMPTYDVSGKVFADALHVRGYPTISVIAPNPEKIVELARIEGYHHGDAIGKSLEKTLGELLKKPLVSIAEAERQFRESGLAYKGHPIGSCAAKTLGNSESNYTTPARLKRELDELLK